MPEQPAASRRGHPRAPHPDPRFRRAVHAADRAPRARARRVLRDPSLGHQRCARCAHSAPRGIILSGGPESVTDVDAAESAGGGVRARQCRCSASATACRPWRSSSAATWSAATEREFGYAEVTVTGPCRLLDELADRRDADGRAVLDVWMSHGDRVDALPQGFTAAAATATMRRSRRWPMSSGASTACSFIRKSRIPARARAILERFVREICGCEARWSAGNIIEDLDGSACAPRSAPARCCSGCPAASIPRWWRRCCIGRSAIS